MRRSSEKTPRNVPGWSTTSDDYLEHISRMVRTLSVSPNVPQYPNVSRAFKNEVRNRAPLDQYQNDLPQQKVEAASEQDNKKTEARGGSAGVEAADDGLVEQKQGKFQLNKWKTFKQV